MIATRLWLWCTVMTSEDHAFLERKFSEKLIELSITNPEGLASPAGDAFINVMCSLENDSIVHKAIVRHQAWSYDVSQLETPHGWSLPSIAFDGDRLAFAQYLLDRHG